MRIALVNVPHPAIGSRIPDEHLPPLGLLCVGGPLIDDGHGVRLFDGEFGPVPLATLAADIAAFAADAVLFGHSGSSSAQPIISAVAAMIRPKLPNATIVYGGGHPTHHSRDTLAADPNVDIIVRGEGEATGAALFAVLRAQAPVDTIRGLAFRDPAGRAIATA